MEQSLSKIESSLLVIVQKFLAELNKERASHSVTLQASLERDLGIDSLGRVELFLKIEKEFSIYLPDSLMAEAETLQDIAKAIQQAEPTLETIKYKYADILAATSFDATSSETLVDVLLKRAENEPTRPHIYLQAEQGEEQVISYGNLLTAAAKVSGGLLKLGLKPGNTVAIMLPTSKEFFYAFFGVLLAGGIPIPIYPPVRADRIEEYALRESAILKTAEVRILITFHKAEVIGKLLKVFIASLKTVTTVDVLLQHDMVLPTGSIKATDGALIQYTSGSTSDPKGVFLKHENLLANIRAIGKTINIQPTDAAVSWLPLYHDMGLIGTWLNCFYHAIPITIISPLAFLTRPERWLWAIHYHRATLSAAPNFAYELCVRKINESAIEGLDLSSWRLALNGAEAINPKTIKRFVKKFSIYGFKEETFYPAYGLAESSVALLFPPLARVPRIDQVSREVFTQQQKAVPEVNTKAQSLEFVSCGSPLPGHRVRIVNNSLQEVKERIVGRLQFCGPSSMTSYHHNPKATQDIYFDGWWDSGDLAYKADGEIYITGREKDIIIKAGRNLYPEAFEDVIGQINGIRQGCIAVFGIQDQNLGTERLIIVAELKEEKTTYQRDGIIAEIIEKSSLVVGVPPDEVILVPARTIPKTSSGKLRRSACKEAYRLKKLGQRKTPAWFQLTKLFFKGSWLTVTSWLTTSSKFAYTCYVILTLCFSLPLILLCLQLLPGKYSAKIVRSWARLTLKMIGILVKVKGKENFETIHSFPIVYIANHASYIDSIILLSILPAGAAFVAKKEVLKIPIVKIFIKKLKYLTVDRMDFAKNIADTNLIIEALRDGRAIIIFAEGTFTYATGLRPFKLGAFKVAAETRTSVCSVALKGTRNILRDGSNLLKPGMVEVTIGQAIIPKNSNWDEITNLHNIIRTEISSNCGEQILDLV